MPRWHLPEGTPSLHLLGKSLQAVTEKNAPTYMWQNLDSLMPSLAVMSPGHAQSQVTQFKKMEVLLRKVHFGS